MQALYLIATFLGIFVAIAVAVMIGLRAVWVHQTYGGDLGFVDRVEAVMTPALWIWAAIAIVLLTFGRSAS